MCLDAKLPPNLWGECAITAFYLAHRTPTHSLQGKTSYEVLYGQKPRISHLRQYSCRVFVLIQNKLNPKTYYQSEECMLVGYSTTSKAYRCWSRQQKCIVISYHVIFIELQDEIPHPLHPRLVIEKKSPGEQKDMEEKEEDEADAYEPNQEAGMDTDGNATPDMGGEEPTGAEE
jgi:hypothetical protein